MPHLSELVSVGNTVFAPGQRLGANLYVYLPQNRTVVFFRRAGDVLSQDDCAKIAAVPKGTLLVLRAEVRRIFASVTESLAMKARSVGIGSPEVRSGATQLLGSLQPGPSGDDPDLAAQLLEELPALVETIVSRMPASPSIATYEKALELSRQYGNDPITAHNAQVSAIAVLAFLSLERGTPGTTSSDALPSLAAAGLLHDLGLREIPQNVRDLHLTGQDHDLTVAELEVYNTHIQRSVGLAMQAVQKVTSETVLAIKLHHENYDGSGPFGMPGDQMPLAPRILRIADDLVGALNHPGKRLGFKEALGLLALRDRHLKAPLYDPMLMDLLGQIK